MTRLRSLEPAVFDAAQRRLYEQIVAGPRNASNLTTEDGSLRGPFGPMLLSPAIGEPLQALGVAIRFAGELPPSCRELAILVVASKWRCDFEWNAHLPLALAAGVDEAQLQTMRDGHVARFGAHDLDLVVRVASEITDTRTLTAESFAAARHELGEKQLFELLALVGYYSTLAIVMNSFDIA